MTSKIPLIKLDWDRANQLVDDANTIVIATHLSPDGDAIGSMMGLTIALREQGKTVYPAVDGGCPDDFHFVPFAEDILDNVTDIEADLFISTDASDKARVGMIGEQMLAKKLPYIQLDHHQTNLIFGDANLVDARTVAACEGVLDWIEKRGWELSQNAAQALLTGLVTDTIGFRTSNVTANTFSKAQTLLAAGADLNVVIQNTLAKMPTSLMKLYGQVLSTVRLENHVIWVSLRPQDFVDSGYNPNGYTGLSGYLIQSEDAYISASFQELEPNVVECSFRSVPGFDVSQVALSLGGGGHVQASGCTVRGKSLEDVERAVVDMLKDQVEAGSPLY